MPLQQLADRVYVLQGGTNIGVVLSDDGGAMLVDSGLNDTPARKALRAVREELGGGEVRAILNTHGHADHFGGNAWLVKRTGAEVWAPAIDATMIRFPVLLSAMLFGGADPADALRTSFLVAEASPVDKEVVPDTTNVAGIQIRVVPLPGHSPNQFGYLIDGVFFCADVIFPEATLKKYPIPYLYGLTEHLRSLEASRGTQAEVIVPGHGPILESIDGDVLENLDAIGRVSDAVLTAATEPSTSDEICARVFAALNAPVSDPQSYYLLRPTISAYLAHLERVGEMRLEIEDHSARWRSH